jgi:hypothetical protein
VIFIWSTYPVYRPLPERHYHVVNKNFAEEYITTSEGVARQETCMELLFESQHPPKTLVLERTDDDRLRLVITLRKLGQETILEYFLDDQDRDRLALALGK